MQAAPPQTPGSYQLDTNEKVQIDFKVLDHVMHSLIAKELPKKKQRSTLATNEWKFAVQKIILVKILNEETSTSRFYGSSNLRKRH
jgi:hypothetical protein